MYASRRRPYLGEVLDVGAGHAAHKSQRNNARTDREVHEIHVSRRRPHLGEVLQLGSDMPHTTLNATALARTGKYVKFTFRAVVRTLERYWMSGSSAGPMPSEEAESKALSTERRTLDSTEIVPPRVAPPRVALSPAPSSAVHWRSLSRRTQGIGEHPRRPALSISFIVFISFIVRVVTSFW